MSRTQSLQDSESSTNSLTGSSGPHLVKPCFCFTETGADFYPGFTIFLLVCHCLELVSIIATMITFRQYGVSLLTLIQATLITLNSLSLYAHYSSDERGNSVQFCYAITMYILTWVYACILMFAAIGFIVYDHYFYLPAHLKTIVSLSAKLSLAILLIPALAYMIYLMHLYYGVVSAAAKNNRKKSKLTGKSSRPVDQTDTDVGTDVNVGDQDFMSSSKRADQNGAN